MSALILVLVIVLLTPPLAAWARWRLQRDAARAQVGPPGWVVQKTAGGFEIWSSPHVPSGTAYVFSDLVLKPSSIVKITGV